jgi:hypothetical protein
LADGRAPGTSYCGEIGFVAGRAVSFQITILKVLAGHPDGRASVNELTRRQHPDVKRIGPDAPVGRARTKARNFC